MPTTLHRAREAALDAALAAAVKRSRKLLYKRALISLQPVTGSGSGLAKGSTRVCEWFANGSRR